MRQEKQGVKQQSWKVVNKLFGEAILRGHKGCRCVLDDYFQKLAVAFVQQLGNVRSIGIAAFTRIDDVLDLGKDGIGHGRFLLFLSDGLKDIYVRKSLLHLSTQHPLSAMRPLAKLCKSSFRARYDRQCRRFVQST